MPDNIEEISYEDAKSEKDAEPVEAEESGDAATVATSAIMEDQSMVEGQQNQEQEDKFAKYEEEYQQLMNELEDEKQE